jgi:hypothetical protein
MAIKHQKQDEKHPFLSPTTPGLFVTVPAYIIELVCLNVNPRIGPRFWSDTKYWGPKFRREVRGVANLGKELDLTNVSVQTALIQVIKENNIGALIAQKTVAKVVKLTNRRIIQRKEQQELLVKKQPPQITIDSKENAIFVDTGERNTLSKIRDVESG